jgi:hypothetical protein
MNCNKKDNKKWLHKNVTQKIAKCELWKHKAGERKIITKNRIWIVNGNYNVKMKTETIIAKKQKG